MYRIHSALDGLYGQRRPPRVGWRCHLDARAGRELDAVEERATIGLANGRTAQFERILKESLRDLSRPDAVEWMRIEWAPQRCSGDLHPARRGRLGPPDCCSRQPGGSHIVRGALRIGQRHRNDRSKCQQYPGGQQSELATHAVRIHAGACLCLKVVSDATLRHDWQQGQT